MRLDLYLLENNYVKSRQKAKSLIEEGNVKINGKIILKPSYSVDEETGLQVEIHDSCPYVSRGGLKLESILQITDTDVSNKVCIDIGASTGGFTHCLLMHGAQKVYAIDSGTDQLASILKNDNRVISIENFNARELRLDDIGELVDVITIDVSFISQCLILPNINKLLKPDGVFLSLIKPQFEVGRSNVGKGGIVKDKRAKFNGVISVLQCAESNSLICTSFTKSPIKGGDGNEEYLALFSFHGAPVSKDYIKKIIFE